jgi:hypothetical protein
MDEKKEEIKEQPKKKRGRPSIYEQVVTNLGQIETLAGFGLTNEQIATFLGINADTLYQYKKKHPEFAEMLKRGKDKANTKVTESLFKRATGFNHPEEKIFIGKEDQVIRVGTIKYYPPETGAIAWWQKNMDSEKWRDRKEIEAKIATAEVSIEDLHKSMLEIFGEKEKE